MHIPGSLDAMAAHPRARLALVLSSGVKTVHVVVHIRSCCGGGGLEGMLTFLACSMLRHVGAIAMRVFTC